MKLFFRLLLSCLLLGCAQLAWSQADGPKIDRVDIKYLGPESVSEQFIRANIRAKAGASYTPELSEADLRLLYGTGQFYNIRVSLDDGGDGGVILTYTVEVNPRISEVKIEGNKRLSDSKIRKEITVKAGEPLDELKVFTDVEAIKKLYEKYGYPDTQVNRVLDIDENAGRGAVTFEITESPKVKIVRVDFIGASIFSPGKLRETIKTGRAWYDWPLFTGTRVYKQDQFEEDKDALTEFYRDRGYLDFEIKDVKLLHPTPDTMAIQFFIFEGRQYKVGSIKFSGTPVFSDDQIRDGLQYVQAFQHSRARLGPHGLPMDVGDVFTPGGLQTNTTAVEDFYGSKGYIDVSQGMALHIITTPNVDTGTMDLEFHIDASEKYYVEKINIHGNLKTKDSVIRRELAISPGEVFNMVLVNISKQRLEGLDYFDKVETQPEPTPSQVPGREDLDVSVEEKQTGNLTFGAGYSSVDALVGYAELDQANFDLFHPPYFTGGGQKFRLRLQLGTQRQDYELSFIEPWFLNRKLSAGVDLYRHQLDFESPNNIFNEDRTGARFSLTRALGSDFLIGTVSYAVEEIGISLNGGWHGDETILTGSPPIPFPSPRNVPIDILNQVGDHFFQRFGGSLAYDTRNSTGLPNHGQLTELDTELDVGDTTYYKVEVKSDWFFPGLFKGHVLEIGGRAGIVDSLSGGDVPFYDRYYLGGIYSLRGFKYRNIGPRDPEYSPGNPNGIPDESIGGDSYWFGSVEYSLPVFERDNGVGIRFAVFYDIGAVGARPFSFTGNFDDNWGLGLRLNIPRLGPLRLDYGIPIHHDKFNGPSGQFQFSAGFTRPF